MGGQATSQADSLSSPGVAAGGMATVEAPHYPSRNLGAPRRHSAYLPAAPPFIAVDPQP